MAEIASECVRCERRDACGYIYTYTLTLHNETKYSSIGIPLYSISVEMTELKTGRSSTASTDKIFADEAVATAFFDKLTRSLATPIDLAYILEDEFT